MLFLPKYGTICVCEAAAVVNPAMSTASRTATADGGRAASGTRVRMGKYLGKGNSWSETGCDLTVTAGRLQTPCSTIGPLGVVDVLWRRRCPTPLGDKTYTGPPMRASCSRTLRRDSLGACPAEALRARRAK